MRATGQIVDRHQLAPDLVDAHDRDVAVPFDGVERRELGVLDGKFDGNFPDRIELRRCGPPPLST